MDEPKSQSTGNLFLGSDVGIRVLIGGSARHQRALEKFEEHSDGIDVVFVLLTPDDTVLSRAVVATSERRRARQNVIFELGFFLGKLGRRPGRVILLHKGDLEIPTDISGLTYISIDAGIEAAGEEIRRELRDFIDTS